MRHIIRTIILTTLLLQSTFVCAQQDLLFTQQHFSRGNINPAGVGNTGDIDIFLLGRMQWLGVDNAPKTILLNATNYFPKIQSGIGLTISHDAIGLGHRTTEVKAEYSYQFDLTPNWILSLGVSAGIFVGTFDPSANTLENETEFPELDIPQTKERMISPDFNVGLEVNSPNWTFGLSCTHIQNNQSTTFRSDRHIYAYAMRAIALRPDWDMMATAAYMNRNKVHLADIGLLTFYRRLFWGGISWRPDIVNGCDPSYLTIMLGFEWQILRFGYLYEWGVGKNSTLPNNTHEFLLSFRIPKKTNGKQ